MENKTLFLIFLFISFSFYLQEETLANPSTTLFNVSDSLLRTRHITTQTKHVTKPLIQDDAMPSLSLSLHPRSSLHKKPESRNYTFLTHARLARDSARVKSILSRIKAATASASGSLRMEDTNAYTFEVPVTSGKSAGSGEYFARLAVGNPPREYYFITDTGSDISWLQCSPCSNCYEQIGPIFDPTQSATYHPLSCNEPQCNQLLTPRCSAGMCKYKVSYGDGSVTIGDFATESLTFGMYGTAYGIAIGCGHTNHGLFSGAAGLLGLGGGPLSLTSQLGATSFSYCLVDRDSSKSSTLDFNMPLLEDSKIAPLLRNPQIGTYQYVDFSGFIVAGREVDFPATEFAIDDNGNGGVIVDSGTAVTHLKEEAYNQLRDAFRLAAQNLPTAEGFGGIFDTCFDFSGLKTATVPKLELVFAGTEILQIRPENYLIPVDSRGKYCFAFTPMESPLSIIGNVQQQGIRVTYDLANSIIGFSPNKC